MIQLILKVLKASLSPIKSSKVTFSFFKTFQIKYWDELELSRLKGRKIEKEETNIFFP